MGGSCAPDLMAAELVAVSRDAVLTAVRVAAISSAPRTSAACRPSTAASVLAFSSRSCSTSCILQHGLHWFHRCLPADRMEVWWSALAVDAAAGPCSLWNSHAVPWTCRERMDDLHPQSQIAKWLCHHYTVPESQCPELCRRQLSNADAVLPKWVANAVQQTMHNQLQAVCMAACACTGHALPAMLP